MLGVLIALGIGEVAEAIRWHSRVQAARASLDAEFDVNATYFYERINSQPCLERRLDEIGDLVLAAQKTGQLPRIGSIGLPSLRPYSSAAWDTTVGNGVTLRMRPAEATELATSVKVIASYSESSFLEQEEWAALSTLEGAPRAISEDLLSDLTRTLAVVRYRTGLQGLGAQQSLDYIKSRNIVPAFKSFGTSAEKSAAFTAKSPMCQPLLGSAP